MLDGDEELAGGPGVFLGRQAAINGVPFCGKSRPNKSICQ